jgi:thiamine transporter ThiT
MCGTAMVCMSAYFHQSAQLCLFKRLIGVACPTCGFTRGIISLLHGHIIQAWLYNPLLYLVLAFAFAFVALRVISARSVRINLTGKECLVAWILAGLLFAVNWFYVIFFVG